MLAFADFSGDEALCLGIAGVITLNGWIAFYRPIFSIPTLGRSVTPRIILACTPVIGLVLVAFILCGWADAEVVGHADYIFLFLVVGAAFLAITFRILPLLGISIRNDAIDRNNSSAYAASIGAMLAVSIIYALSNVGGGATIWTTIVPAAQGVAVIFLLMVLMEFASAGLSESVTIDRDFATGIRFAGALVGCGIVLGRAAGGIWISAEQSLVDLARFGWPAVVIAVAASFVHRMLRSSFTRTGDRTFIGGIVPAVIFVAAGFCVVLFMPHGLRLSQW